jgi:hypothetical protein
VASSTPSSICWEKLPQPLPVLKKQRKCSPARARANPIAPVAAL